MNFYSNLTKNSIFKIKPGIAALLILKITLIITLFTLIESAGATLIDTEYKQVKVYGDSTVYYLDHSKKMKKAYVNEQSFFAYDNTWQQVKIVEASALADWENVELVKLADSAEVYYINSKKKYLIKSEQEFIDNGFSWDKIVIINPGDLATYETVEKIEEAGFNLEIATTAGFVQAEFVRFDTDKYIPVNTEDNLVATLKLKSGNANINLKSIKLKFPGVYPEGLIAKAYITNDADYVYDENSAIKDREVIFRFGRQGLDIYAGQSKNFNIYVNLNDCENCLNSNIQVEIESENDINLSGTLVSGFPIKSEATKIVYASENFAQITALEETINPGSFTAVTGITNQIISRFAVAETSNREDVLLQKIVLKSNGEINEEDLVNFVLKDKNNKTIAKTQSMTTNKELIFNLDNYIIQRNTDVTFRVYADINSGDSKEVNFDIEDIKATGKIYGFSIKENIDNLNESFIIEKNTVSIIAETLEANKKVFTNKSGTIIGNFEVRTNNQEIYLEGLSLSLVKNASAVDLDNTVYLANYDTGEIYDAFDGRILSSDSVEIAFSSLRIKRNSELSLAFFTELPNELDNGDIYKLVINKIYYETENKTTYTDVVNREGEEYSVDKGSLYVYKNNELEDDELYYSKGVKRAKIASFILEAATGNDIVINNVTIVNAGGSGLVTYTNGFSNLLAYVSSKKSKTVISEPNASSYEFDGFNYRLKEGKSVELKIYADIDEGANVNEVQLALSAIDAYGYKSDIEANISGINVASEGVEIGSVDAEIEILSGGSIASNIDNNLVGSFKIINNGNEDIKLKYITINSTGNAFSYNAGYNDLKIVDRAKDSRVGRNTKPVANANKVSLGGYKLEKNTEKIYDIYVDTNENVAPSEIQIYLSDLVAYGVNSKIYVDAAGGPTLSAPVSTSEYSEDIAEENEVEDFVWPVNGRVTYGFEDEDYPFRYIAEHTGIDIDVAQGTPVKAVAAGEIIALRDGGDTGYSYIMIEHSDELSTVYGHISRIDVVIGQEVEQGEIIGLSGGEPGTSGAGTNTTGPHLHFEVHLNGTPVDPADYLN